MVRMIDSFSPCAHSELTDDLRVAAYLTRTRPTRRTPEELQYLVRQEPSMTRLRSKSSSRQLVAAPMAVLPLLCLAMDTNAAGIGLSTRETRRWVNTSTNRCAAMNGFPAVALRGPHRASSTSDTSSSILELLDGRRFGRLFAQPSS